jgi:RNA polymerase sigma-70 factor (ECF subfamily)
MPLARDGSAGPESHRPHLEALAYRLLGSMAEAEDAVQDAFLRYAQNEENDIDNPRAWLTTVVTNRCIDMLRAARHRRETYVGEWLPEPVATDDAGRPELAADRADSLSLAFLTLLERLSPLERAAYLLHDIFDYDYAEVARILNKKESACRQLASRARRHIGAGRPRFPLPSADTERDSVIERFVAAVQAGDATALLGILKDDIVLWNDGGGKAKAALNPIRGADKVARFFLSTADKLPDGVTWQPREINGDRGFLGLYPDGTPYAVLVFEVLDGHIAAIRSILNPDKLAAFC